MKKFLSLIISLLLGLSVSFSASADVRVGVLSKLNTNDGGFIDFVRTEGLWKELPGSHGDNDLVVFYDTIMSMLMSINAGDIDEMELPGVVGAYVLNSRPDLKISCMVRTDKESLAFGFLKNGGEALRDKFNEVLDAMEKDGTLNSLRSHYLKVDGEPEAVEFPKFDAADTIRVAVTGDLPPIDYVAMNGKAAGFNTALLAEIAKKLKVNIRLNYINSASRAAALVSGRADAVFWYQLSEGSVQNDVPDSVIVSKPYYDWNTFVHIGKKTEAASNGN